MTRHKLSAPGRLAFWCALTLAIWALVTFLFVPLFSSFDTAFMRDGRFAILEVGGDLFSSRRVRTAIWNTVWMTAITTVTVAIVGVFQVMVLEYFHVRGRAVLKIIFAIPLVFNSIIAATGYDFTYGPGGAVTVGLQQFFPDLRADWFRGWFGVWFLQTFHMTSFFFLFLRAAMRRVDYSTVEAARSLGANEWTILRRILLPVIFPTLMAVILLVIYGAIGSFAAPQVLGTRDFYMLSQITLTLNSLRRHDMAAVLALTTGLIVMGLILLSQYYEAKGSYVGGSKTPTPIQLRPLQSPIANSILHALCYMMAFIYLLPLGIVILFSFAPSSSIGVEALPTSLTLKNYLRVFTDGAAFTPALNSIKMGTVAVLAGLALTLFAVPIMVKSRGWLARILDISLFLPWVVPSILVAVGLIAAFDRPNFLIGGGVLVGSFWILPIAYTVTLLPLMVRFFRAAFVGLDPTYEEAAQALGAGGFYRFRRVVLPIILPTVILIAGISLNDLMTEYPLSAFLYNVNNRPLPIAIVQGAMSHDPEQKAVNLVYSVLIMLFSLAVILCAERMGLGRGPKKT